MFAFSLELKMHHTLTKKSLATLDGEIVDPWITVKLEMQDVLKSTRCPNIYTIW